MISEHMSVCLSVHRFVFFNVWIMLNVLVGILVEAYLTVRARDVLMALAIDSPLGKIVHVSDWEGQTFTKKSVRLLFSSVS